MNRNKQHLDDEDLSESTFDSDEETNHHSGIDNTKENECDSSIPSNFSDTEFSRHATEVTSKLKPNRKAVYTNPNKQKTLVHSLLKKARVFEIRKITRRITKLRNLKSTEDEKIKNMKKVDRLLREMEEMKGFIIESLCSRVLKILNDDAENSDRELWEAAINGPKVIEKMISKLAAKADDDAIREIAFFKIISSKDINRKLKFISEGVNISSRKKKKANISKNKKPNTSKHKQDKNENKTDRNRNNAQRKQTSVEKKKLATKKNSAEENNIDIEMDTIVQEKSSEKSPKLVSKRFPKNDKNTKQTIVQKEKQKNTTHDSFFLSMNDISDGEVYSDSEKDEFVAPVLPANKSIVPLKSKNRMGQRQRKQLLEKSNRNKTFGNKDNKARFPRQSKFNKRQPSHGNRNLPVAEKKIDKDLHPSWIAKQSLKAKQSINVFSGSKIVFDD